MRFIWRIPQIPIAFLALGMLAMFVDKAVSGERLDWGALGFGTFLAVAAVAIEFRIRELASTQQRGTVVPAPGQAIVARRRPLTLVSRGVGVMFVFLLGAMSLRKGYPFPAALWFAACAVLAAMLAQSIRDRQQPKLRIDEQGLEIYDIGRIPWADVRTVQIRTVSSRYSRVKLLELRLRDAQRYVRRLSGVKGWLARLRASRDDSIVITLSNLDLPPQEVYEAVRARHQAYRRRHNLPLETGEEALDAKLAAIHGIMNELDKAQQPEEVVALTTRLKSADAALRSALDEQHRKVRKSVRQHLVFLAVALAGLAVLIVSSFLSRT